MLLFSPGCCQKRRLTFLLFRALSITSRGMMMIASGRARWRRARRQRWPTKSAHAGGTMTKTAIAGRRRPPHFDISLTLGQHIADRRAPIFTGAQQQIPIRAVATEKFVTAVTIRAYRRRHSLLPLSSLLRASLTPMSQYRGRAL